MNDDPFKDDRSPNSVSGRSAAFFVEQETSLAGVLRKHEVTVRDFVLMSFLADQGSMSIDQLAGIVGVEPTKVIESVTRLSSAGLVLRDSKSTQAESEQTVRLTDKGQDIVGRINAQL